MIDWVRKGYWLAFFVYVLCIQACRKMIILEFECSFEEIIRIRHRISKGGHGSIFKNM
uniref:Uncharacterized protein n=1 Tax=Medicago truncatula TaxID=3880 RepID=A2Q644_MEDTR|nr:hypothetical protein MtrDRAFT_AC172744g7v1 [Medicago truncatula]